MSDRQDVALLLSFAVLVASAYVYGISVGREEGIARATCYAAHLPYVETTSAGVVCGEPAVLLPILVEVKP